MKHPVKISQNKFIRYCLRFLPSLGCMSIVFLLLVWEVCAHHSMVTTDFICILMTAAATILLPMNNEPMTKRGKILAVIFIILSVFLFALDFTRTIIL